jgi:AcrR family transcriptional regulator
MRANTAGELTFEAILATLEAAHAGEQPVVEGLRDRKKRRLRQRISDVATALFLAEGFDTVSVARIAAICDVSEQTVFNYFPTKESMFFDRIESSTDAMAAAIRSQTDASLGQIVLGVLFADASLERPRGVEHADALRLFRRFCEVAQGSLTLRAAPYLEMERFTDAVGRALAQRVGKEPDDPDVILTAIVIAGLSHVRTQATYRRVQTMSSMAAVHRAVQADVMQAVRIATPALEAFARATETSAAADER